MAIPILASIGKLVGQTAIPFIIGGLSKIPEVLKTIWEGITAEPAQAAALLNAVTDQSTANEISQAAEVFEIYKEKVRKESKKIEKAVTEEVEYFLKEITLWLQENRDVLSRYQIRTSTIERRTLRILSKIEGCIDREISRQVSLDNPECKRILALPSGSRKEQEMTDFFQSSLKNALEKTCGELKEMLEEIFEELDEELPGAVERSREEAERCSRELQMADDGKNVEKTQQIMENAVVVMAECDVALGLLEV